MAMASRRTTVTLNRWTTGGLLPPGIRGLPGRAPPGGAHPHGGVVRPGARSPWRLLPDSSHRGRSEPEPDPDDEVEPVDGVALCPGEIRRIPELLRPGDPDVRSEFAPD